ncbi:mannose-6-phosphate isomerase, class I [Pseudoclavibacter endophyticus]|uniref:mannose-6-phosphate isomerase n=1 Tax=Pseudoclavibacter endophyticus TaxID=1778590 RepID=A0A6H9WS31_9MICO|nr:mannose-6-phosphate isomerase, class I [Pseudoclavibacter endophyticus]KAB1649124.1 mannose-6-phosphate isomerase, class I [Pseudoclavibacter endophyticus]GGA65230.1 mannose-6-phosphate isomerase, class I [Pseudoclavibacter endophyticus]
MFVRIRNTPLDYAWGTDGEITRLLGDGGDSACEPRTDGGPEAELWLGAHQGAPSRIVDRELVGGAVDLREWIEADPATTLGPLAGTLREGERARLPFLLKVLAAGAPLSLQAHPSLEHARDGFARENALGIPIDAPLRNYRDPWHKPELLLALSDTMEAVAGFRRNSEVIAVLDALIAARDAQAATPVAAGADALAAFRARLAKVSDEPGRREVVAWLLARGADAVGVTEAVVEASRTVVAAATAGVTPAPTELERVTETVTLLADRYPGDPGVVIALLLNRITLRRGEALFVGAGSMHAYLRGVGVEIMASSDNVLRGGLTPKHVDVPELLRILDASEVSQPLLESVDLGDGVFDFRPDVADFRLLRVTRADRDGPSAIDAPGPAIILGLSGEARVRGNAGAVRLRAGAAVYATPDEGRLEIEGECDALIATVGAPPV